MNKYLELDQEVPYLVVETLLVHLPVLVQSHEKKKDETSQSCIPPPRLNPLDALKLIISCRRIGKLELYF